MLLRFQKKRRNNIKISTTRIHKQSNTVSCPNMSDMLTWFIPKNPCNIAAASLSFCKRSIGILFSAFWGVLGDDEGC